MSHFVRTPMIPGQGPKLILNLRNLRGDVRVDTSALSELTRPAVERSGPIIPGGEHVCRRADEVAKGLGLGSDQERDLTRAMTEWLAAPDVLAFRKSLIQGLRKMAPTDHALRSEVVRRAVQVWKSTRAGYPSRRFGREGEPQDVIQKARRAQVAAGQMGLFDQPAKPKPKPKPAAKPKPKPKPVKLRLGRRPRPVRGPRGGWQAVPRSRIPGAQRRWTGTHWEYRYPDGKGGYTATPPKVVPRKRVAVAPPKEEGIGGEIRRLQAQIRRAQKTIDKLNETGRDSRDEMARVELLQDELNRLTRGTPAKPPPPPEPEPEKPKPEPKPEPKPKRKKKEIKEPTKERYSEEHAYERLLMIGDWLYETQAENPKEFDSAGLSRYDMGVWRMAQGSQSSVKHILAKYKRQIGERFGEDEWHKLGLGDYLDARANITIKPAYHPRWGSLQLPVAGFIPKKKFPKYMDAMRYLKNQGLAKFVGGPPWFVPAEKIDQVTPEIWATFSDMMEEAGVTVGSMPPPPEKKKKPAAGDVVVEPTAEEVIARIKARRAIPKTIALTRDKDGLFHFYSPYSPTFNDVFSNKKGMISGITEYNPNDHARMTYDLALVEEAIDKLKSVLPGWKVVTSGLAEAQRERDEREAELRKPIPAVAEKLDPQYKLFPYQNEAVRFLQEKDGRALVGDEMGLGKTLQSLAYAAAEGKRMLVVVPKVVRRTWIQEAEKFFPDYFKGKGRELVSSELRKPKSKGGGQPDLSDVNIAAVNYESLHKFLPAIKAAGFDTIVVDESHRMKSPKAKITKTISSLKDHFPHRILLSGTAVKNKKDELHTQVEFIEPGLFSRHELKMGTIGGVWNKLKRSVYIARQKRTVLPDLPDKTTQITEHPVSGMPVFPKDIGEMSAARIEAAKAKAPVTAAFVKEMLDTSDSSVLVFSESKETAEEIKAALGDVAILHHGQMSDDKREAAKAEFQREGTAKRVFVSTRQSLAVGATLTAADKVVFNDIPWTAADLRQAEDRAHRVGQKNNVNIYWMTAQESSWDKTASAILLRKYELNRKINEGKQLTEEERKWMTQPVKLDEIKKELAGVSAGPKSEDSAEIEKAWNGEDEDAIEKSWDGQLDRLRPRLVLRQTSHPLELVWMAEELPDELHERYERQPPGWGRDTVEKAAGHKYLKRIPTGKPKPKYRYFYRQPKGRGLTSSDDLQSGAKFKVEHAGQLGHFEVEHHDKAKGLVRVKHDESGKVAHIRERDLHRMITAHHAKQTERARPDPLQLRREEQQQRLTGTEAKARKPKKEKSKKPAPKLPRATMDDLGKGGFDNIEGFSANAKDLEEQAHAAGGDKEYAVIPQAGGFVLASRVKVTGAVKEARGDKTTLVMRGAKGKSLDKVEVDYVVMEASDLVASHDPTSFEARREYPEGVQERRYEVQGSGDQGKIDRIAREMEPSLMVNTNPSAIDGSPMVTEDGIVLGGNGRTMGLQRAYKLYPEKAQEMKDYLAQHARAFGVSSAELAKMKQPVLVRRLKAGGKDLTALGRRMNEALTQGMDPRTIEVALGQNYVTPELMDSLTHTMDPGQSLSEFLRTARSRPFVQALERAGVIDQYNKDEFVERGKGVLNEDGRMRVERVLTARMIPDASALSRMGTRMRQLVAKSVPSLIQMQRSGWDVQEALHLAVKADNDMRLEGFSGGKRQGPGGKSVSIPMSEHRTNYQKQLAGFDVGGEHLPTALGKNPLAQLMLEAIQDKADKNMPSKWRQVALEADRQRARKAGAGEAKGQAMLGGAAIVEERSLEDTIRSAFGLKAGGEPGALEGQGGLFAMSMPEPDLVKAGAELTGYLMHAVLWEVDNLMRGALGSGEKPSGAQLLKRLQNFIQEQTRADKRFAQALGAHPLSTAALKGLLKASAMARSTELAKSMARNRLFAQEQAYAG